MAGGSVPADAYRRQHTLTNVRRLYSDATNPLMPCCSVWLVGATVATREEGSTKIGIELMVNQHFSDIEAEYCLAEGNSPCGSMVASSTRPC